MYSYTICTHNKYTDIICIKINIKAMKMAGISEHISKESGKKKKESLEREMKDHGEKKKDRKGPT